MTPRNSQGSTLRVPVGPTSLLLARAMERLRTRASTHTSYCRHRVFPECFSEKRHTDRQGWHNTDLPQMNSAAFSAVGRPPPYPPSLLPSPRSTLGTPRKANLRTMTETTTLPACLDGRRGLRAYVKLRSWRRRPRRGRRCEAEGGGASARREGHLIPQRRM